jgi:hypothetical protein
MTTTSSSAPRHHGPIEEILTDVFVVRAEDHVAPLARVPRNVTILRRGEDLVVIDGMRLAPETEAHLERLGRVRHLVRLGHAHPRDEAYLEDRWRAPTWAPPPAHGATPLADGHAPFLEGTQVFLFRHAAPGEAALVFEHTGGNVLVTAESVHNCVDLEGCSLLVGVALHLAGAVGPARLGRRWLVEAGGPSLREDFERLLEHDFAHLVCSRGEPMRGGAREAVRRSVAAVFGAA